MRRKEAKAEDDVVWALRKHGKQNSSLMACNTHTRGAHAKDAWLAPIGSPNCALSNFTQLTRESRAHDGNLRTSVY